MWIKVEMYQQERMGDFQKTSKEDKSDGWFESDTTFFLKPNLLK